MRIRGIVVALWVAAVAVAAPERTAAQDPADVAWNEGDLATAERLYTIRVGRDSTDERALHRLALINAWADRHDAALALFDALLRVAPSNLEARRDRARGVGRKAA